MWWLVDFGWWLLCVSCGWRVVVTDARDIWIGGGGLGDWFGAWGWTQKQSEIQMFVIF